MHVSMLVSNVVLESGNILESDSSPYFATLGLGAVRLKTSSTVR